MDGAGVSYVFGVNQNGELQTLYWESASSPATHLPPRARCRGPGAIFR